jgi:hypothetical protein
MVLRNSTLVLNSKDRDVPTDPTNNFSITLARPVFNVVKAEFRYFFLENGIWNIDSEGNEFELNLTEIDGGAETSGIIVIPPGYYSQVALCNAIQDQCNDLVDGAISVVEINPSGRLVFKSELYTFIVGFLLGNAVQQQTALLLGFDFGSTPSVAVGAEQVVVGTREVSIASYPYIYLQSSKLQNQLLTSSTLSAFALVPMTSSLQGIGNTDVALGTTYDGGAYPLDASYFTQPITLDRIDIRLVDDRGVLIDTRQNDVSIVLRLAHTV